MLAKTVAGTSSNNCSGAAGDGENQDCWTYRFMRVVRLCILFDAIVAGFCLKQGASGYTDRCSARDWESESALSQQLANVVINN